MQLANSQRDALARVERTGAWTDAKDVLVLGCGTAEAAQETFPLLVLAWNRQRTADKERACVEAMAGDDCDALELALALPSAETTAVMERCAAKLCVLRARAELAEAVGSENEARLEGAVAQAEAAGIAAVSEAKAMLARLSRARRLAAAVHAPNQTAEALLEVLSPELWNGAPVPEDAASSSLLAEGLARWTAVSCAQRVAAALESGDAAELNAAVRSAVLAGLSEADVPQLAVATPLCDVNGALAALDAALAEDDFNALRDALQRAQAAGVEPAEPAVANGEGADGGTGADGGEAAAAAAATEDGSDALHKVKARCSRQALMARSRVLAIEAERALEESDADVERLRQATLKTRRLVAKGWLAEPNALSKAERSVRQRKSLALLEAAVAASPTGDVRQELFELAAALEVCEKNGVDKAARAFVGAKARHERNIDRLLESEGLAVEEHRKQVIAMGVEYLDDLALLTEGDLRQAGVPRISVRKVLPRLLQVGAQAHARCVQAAVDFENALKV